MKKSCIYNNYCYFFKYLVLKNIWHQNLHTSEIKAAKFKVENTTEIIFGIFHYYIKNQPATIATTTSTATSTKKNIQPSHISSLYRQQQQLISSNSTRNTSNKIKLNNNKNHTIQQQAAQQQQYHLNSISANNKKK